MPPEPSEKRTLVLSSEEDSQSSVLAEDAMLLIEDIQTKLEKLKVLDKLTSDWVKLNTIQSILKPMSWNWKKALTMLTVM